MLSCQVKISYATIRIAVSVVLFQKKLHFILCPSTQVCTNGSSNKMLRLPFDGTNHLLTT